MCRDILYFYEHRAYIYFYFRCAQSNGRVACLDNNGELAVINVNGKNNVISHKIANYDNSTDKASLDAVVSCSKSPVFIAAFSRDQVVIRISNDEISSKLLPEGFSNADGYSLCSFVDNDLYFSVTLLDPVRAFTIFVWMYGIELEIISLEFTLII